MITPVFPSRRAERFAQLLDEAAGARRHHSRSDADSDLTGMVTIGQRVTTLPLVVEVDNEFRTGLRASLMARIEREGIGATAAEPEADTPQNVGSVTCCRSGRTRSAIIATVAAGSFGAFGVSAASGDAMPGDTLYKVKRSAEQAQLALAGSDVSRGQLNLDFARKRLTEAGGVGGDMGELDPVLDDMDSDMRDGTRLLTLAAIDRGEAAGLQAVHAVRPRPAADPGQPGRPARRSGEDPRRRVARPDQPHRRAGRRPVHHGEVSRRSGSHRRSRRPADRLRKRGTAGVVAQRARRQSGGDAETDRGCARPAPPTRPVRPSAAEPTQSVEVSPTASADVAESEEDDGVLDSIKRAVEGLFG